jgi:hypothetical protein
VTSLYFSHDELSLFSPGTSIPNKDELIRLFLLNGGNPDNLNENELHTKAFARFMSSNSSVKLGLVLESLNSFYPPLMWPNEDNYFHATNFFDRFDYEFVFGFYYDGNDQSIVDHQISTGSSIQTIFLIPPNFFIDGDSNRFYSALNWMIAAALSPEKDLQEVCLNKSKKFLETINLENILNTELQDVSSLGFSDYLFMPTIDDEGHQYLATYLKLIESFSKHCFRVKECSVDEYKKALLFDNRPVLFNFVDKKGTHYMVQWALYEDLESLFHRTILEGDEHKHISKLTHHNIYAHISPAIDWLLDRLTMYRPLIQNSNIVQVKDNFSNSPKLEVKLDDLDPQQTLRNRVKGEESGKYSTTRLGSENYEEFEILFLEFYEPLKEIKDIILPTLFLGDLLPMGYTIDGAEGCIGNPMMMFANLLSYEIFEQFDMKEGLRDEIIEKYNKSTNYSHDQDELVKLYQRAEIITSIFEIGAHFNRLKKSGSRDYKGHWLRGTSDYNIKGIRHFYSLAKKGLTEFGEEGSELLTAFENYISTSNISDIVNS